MKNVKNEIILKGVKACSLGYSGMMVCIGSGFGDGNNY
jgi:hypothetical protein